MHSIPSIMFFLDELSKYEALIAQKYILKYCVMDPNFPIHSM